MVRSEFGTILFQMIFINVSIIVWYRCVEKWIDFQSEYFFAISVVVFDIIAILSLYEDIPRYLAAWRHIDSQRRKEDSYERPQRRMMLSEAAWLLSHVASILFAAVEISESGSNESLAKTCD